MSGPNAALTVPPGDRDDAPPAPSSNNDLDGSQMQDGTHVEVVGRKPATGGGSLEERLAALAAVLDEGQLVLGEIRMAMARDDGPSALAAAWRLREALMADVRQLAAEITRELAQGRRKAMHEELRS